GIVSADVNPSGTFSSLSYTGTEFVAWGTPLSYYWLNSSMGTAVANNAAGSNPLGAFTSGAGFASFTFASGGLSVVENITLVGAQANVQVSLINNTASAITGVQWGVGIDPDQGIPGAGGTFATTNSIVGQGANAAVKAADPYSPHKSVELRNTIAPS